jgi:hypothetical protein
MKINFIMLIIAFGIAALAAFGFYSGNSGETYRILIAIGSGLSFFIVLGGLLALSSPHGGTFNIKVTSILFFIAFLIEHLIFSFTVMRLAPYVIITGIMLLVYVLVSYAIIKALK